MLNLEDYGQALMAVERHEASTRKLWRQLLGNLGLAISAAPGLAGLPAFEIRETGAGARVTAKRAHFDFLQWTLLGLPETRFRVLLSIDGAGALSCDYYLTVRNVRSASTHVILGLQARRAEILQDIGVVDLFGALTPEVYHIKQRLDDATLRGLLSGEESQMDSVAETMGRFFAVVLGWVEVVRSEAGGQDGDVSAPEPFGPREGA